MKNRLTFFLIISLFLLGLFSFSIWAAVPTAVDALGNLGKFLVSLTGGKANWEQAYLLSFILYFILFMAIFVEGLKMLPFFGGKGEISTPGKWFAAAAAGLATLGIFMGEQATGKTGKDFVEYITAPFGVWGGVVLAGLIALISYKGIKDSGVFGEEHLIPMALAAAIGVTIAGWLLSMGNMLGWGFLIMLVVFIVGLVLHLGKVRRERREGEAEEAPEERKAEKRVEKEEEFAEREFKELDKLKELVTASKDIKDLNNAKSELRTIEGVERKMDRRFKRLEKAVEKAKKVVSGDKAAELDKELKQLEVYRKELIVLLSRGGTLDKALMYPDPKPWNHELLGTKVKGNNFGCRKGNSLLAINAALKWDSAFYEKLKEFEKLAKEK